MTDYTTRTLAEALMPAEAEANPKAAGRELRKFLRAEVTAQGGKVGTDTPGKGGRYTLTLNKREVTAMAKRLKAWQEAEAKAADARRAARDAASTEAEVTTPEVVEEESDTEVEGPTDEEIAAMLSDDGESDIED
jgi:membrane protein involved in colicin uptake